MKEKEALQEVAAQLDFEFVLYGLNTLDDLESAFAAGLRDDVSAPDQRHGRFCLGMRRSRKTQCGCAY
jgi:hypothetical protein